MISANGALPKLEHQNQTCFRSFVRAQRISKLRTQERCHFKEDIKGYVLNSKLASNSGNSANAKLAKSKAWKGSFWRAASGD
jgi:hypothetical protein